MAIGDVVSVKVAADNNYQPAAGVEVRITGAFGASNYPNIYDGTTAVVILLSGYHTFGGGFWLTNTHYFRSLTGFSYITGVQTK